jgi:hypothetical protein
MRQYSGRCMSSSCEEGRAVSVGSEVSRARQEGMEIKSPFGSVGQQACPQRRGSCHQRGTRQCDRVVVGSYKGLSHARTKLG